MGRAAASLCPRVAPLPTVLPVLALGARPLLIDNQPGSLAMGAGALAAKIRPDTVAVISVPLCGYPADTYDAHLIEDTAQAHGIISAGKLAGTTGTAGCFSTHDRKLLATGEGGFILTNNPGLHKAVEAFTRHDHPRGNAAAVNFAGPPRADQAAGRVHGRARPCHRRQRRRHPMIRHFTATGIVLHRDTVLLIEHVKLGWWMPPGGHIDPDEDPVQAVLREVREETGLDCAIIAPDVFAHDAVQVLPAPFTILVEDVPEAGQTVQHIDCIYVLRPTSDPAALAAQAGEVQDPRWVPVSQVGELRTPPELPALIHAAAQSVNALTGA